MYRFYANIIFFCAPLLRQLPLCSLPCHSLSADAEGCAAGLVFMCVSRASLACCDCYPQQLFGKLGAAAAVSGFRAQGARPLSSALPHGSPEDRSDDPRRTTGAQRENIDMHGRLHGVRLSSTYLCTGGRSFALSSTYVCIEDRKKQLVRPRPLRW